MKTEYFSIKQMTCKFLHEQTSANTMIRVYMAGEIDSYLERKRQEAIEAGENWEDVTLTEDEKIRLRNELLFQLIQEASKF